MPLMWTIERDGKYYGQWGWTNSLDQAMRFVGVGDADAGLAALKKSYPGLMAGAAVQERDYQGTYERPRLAEHAYNPWGLRK